MATTLVPAVEPAPESPASAISYVSTAKPTPSVPVKDPKAPNTWPCEFKRRLKNPDDASSYLYQVSVRGKSRLLKIGDKIGPWIIREYREIIIPARHATALDDTIAVDASELHLVHEITKKECRLVLRKAFVLPE